MQSLEGREPEGLALHAGLGVERLVKAALLVRNPAFLVDFANKDHAWKSLMLLAGFQPTATLGRASRLYTVGVEVGLKRLMDLGVAAGHFDGRDVESFAVARNSAVHGGGEEVDPVVLGGTFVRIVDALLADLGIAPIDHWGPYFEAAVEVKGGEELKLREDVRMRIVYTSEIFEGLSDAAIEESVVRAELTTARAPQHRTHVCPACGNPGLLDGSYLQKVAREEEGDVADQWLFVVNDFWCPACRLGLVGQVQVRLAGLPSEVHVLEGQIPRQRSEASLQASMFEDD